MEEEEAEEEDGGGGGGLASEDSTNANDEFDWTSVVWATTMGTGVVGGGGGFSVGTLTKARDVEDVDVATSVITLFNKFCNC